jgi:Spy/CpxP family protein refolding chaperone
MKKTILIGLTAVTLLTVSADARWFGGDEPRFGEKSCGHHKAKKRLFKKIFEISDLTDEQREAIISELKSMREKREEFRKDRKAQKLEELQSVITEKGFDKEKFIQIEKDLHSRKVEGKAELFKKIFDILTPKQRVEFKNTIQEELSRNGKRD